MVPLELEHTLNEGNSHNGSGNIPIEDGKAITKYQNREGWAAIPFIIGSIVGLTLSISSWASTLIVFLIKEFNVKSIDATQINNVVLGLNTLLPVAGAILADVFPSYFVISFFAFVSLLGMILFNLITTIHSLRPSPCELMGSIPSCPSPSRLQLAILYITLGLASLGVGGTRFTIATMGAAQFDKPKNQRAFLSLYFLAFYVANGTGLTAMIYIEDNVGWNLAFWICLVSNVIALVLFLSGKRFYRRKPKVERNPFLSFVHVVLAAIQKRNISGTFGNRDYYYGS
ncbi:Proton-dependent oligopeptide transporter family, partial [Corchorus capsularis]